jgi:hypothetical protein
MRCWECSSDFRDSQATGGDHYRTGDLGPEPRLSHNKRISPEHRLRRRSRNPDAVGLGSCRGFRRPEATLRTGSMHHDKVGDGPQPGCRRGANPWHERRSLVDIPTLTGHRCGWLARTPTRGAHHRSRPVETPTGRRAADSAIPFGRRIGRATASVLWCVRQDRIADEIGMRTSWQV